MLARLFIRLIDLNRGWARPLGDFYVRLLRPLLRAVWPLKDFLNGKWLGHSLHGAITDLAIGALLSVSVLDVLGFAPAADALLVVGILAMTESKENEVCLTCGCMDAHMEVGEANIRYEDVKRAADENGRWVAETIEIMERTTSKDRMEHAKEYAGIAERPAG